MNAKTESLALPAVEACVGCRRFVIFALIFMVTVLFYAGRDTACALFNSAQYMAVGVFAPLMAWLTHSWGWEHVLSIADTERA